MTKKKIVKQNKKILLQKLRTVALVIIREPLSFLILFIKCKDDRFLCAFSDSSRDEVNRQISAVLFSLMQTIIWQNL